MNKPIQASLEQFFNKREIKEIKSYETFFKCKPKIIFNKVKESIDKKKMIKKEVFDIFTVFEGHLTIKIKIHERITKI